MRKYWLDVDGLIASFCSHFWNYLNLPDHDATEWNDSRIRDNFHLVAEDLNFWFSMPAMNTGIDPRRVAGYITTRPISSEATKTWLHMNKFPMRSVITVKHGGSKGEILKNIKDAVLVDDGAHNYEDCVKHGVECYLYDTTYNRHIETDKRIYSLSELP